MRLIDADELKKPVGSYNPVKWTSEYGYVISIEDIDHAPTIDTSKELICTVNVNMDTDEVLERLKERGWEPMEHGLWITCDERMPEEPFGCLVTVMDTNPMTGEEFENVLPYFVGWDGEQWNDYDGDQCPFEVLAWMPLPEPWKGEEHG